MVQKKDYAKKRDLGSFWTKIKIHGFRFARSKFHRRHLEGFKLRYYYYVRQSSQHFKANSQAFKSHEDGRTENIIQGVRYRSLDTSKKVILILTRCSNISQRLGSTERIIVPLITLQSVLAHFRSTLSYVGFCPQIFGVFLTL